jgi:hypothetical protein
MMKKTGGQRMKRVFCVLILVFLLVALQQVTYADEVNGALCLGYSYASMSGDICNNMGSVKSGSGFYYGTIVKDDTIAFIISESYLNFKGTNSIPVDIADGPDAGYQWDTSLSLNCVNFSGGMVLFKYFIPHIGLNYYYGEKTYERMEPAPYYWERTTDKVGFALGLNEGLLIYIPFSERWSLSIMGGFNQIFFNKIFNGGIASVIAVLNWGSTN